MYIHDVFVENMGAIEKFQLRESQLIKQDGNPKPIILVGRNGSGKTTLISSIVDALYEFTSDSFSDVLPQRGAGRLYFKISGSTNVRVNQNYAFSFINFKRDGKIYQYLDKNLEIDFTTCKRKTNDLLNLVNNDNESFKIGNKKVHTDTSGDLEFQKDFERNSYCYFPSDRYELPYWINHDVIAEDGQFQAKGRFSGELNKKILIRTSLDEVKQWILDVVLDTRADIIFDPETGRANTRQNFDELKLLQKSLSNIEELISKIVQQDISIGINYRLKGSSRIKLVDRVTNEDYIPALNNLSAGQSTLLSIFITIIMHSDVHDLSKSIELEKISGIVIIDEVDLHLHIELQKEVLPTLIKLFPKIQFIISSHSPFFLAGMTEVFDEDDYLIVNMPSGIIVKNIDEFEEVSKAYSIFKDMTEDYKVELDTLKSELQNSSRPLIITEGKTDWKHLKAALEGLKEEFPDLENQIEFSEFEDDMGYSELQKKLEALKGIGSPRKIIGIFDRDEPRILKDYGGEKYTDLGNNIYAMCLPKINEDLDLISIEHFYSKEDFERIDIEGRRLFDGRDFSKMTAISSDLEYVIGEKNKAGKLVIIDQQVYRISDKTGKSIALSKNDFADNILTKAENFRDIDFNNFKKIFEILDEIVKL